MKKVGGIWFIRLFSLRFSFCIAKNAKAKRACDFTGHGLIL